MLAPRDRDPDPSGRDWQRAVQVAALLAIDPAGLGGVRVRAHAGPVRDAWLALLKQLMDARAWVRVPLSATDERLLGGLDLSATLAAGRPVLQTGLLSSANGGLLILAMAERVTTGVAARITQVMDQREVAIERDGLRERSATRFGVIALDEGLQDDEGVPDALCDRMAFDIDLRSISPRVVEDTPAMISDSDVTQARARLDATDAEDSVIDALCSVALALGVHALRASSLALSAARANAALDGNAVCTDDDAQIAAALVLAPRATQLPASDEPAPEEESAPDTDPTPEPPPPQDETSSSQDDAQGAMEDRVLDAAQAAIPAGLLAGLLSGLNPRRASVGKSGAAARSGLRGRPVGSRRVQSPRGQRLHLVDTLRAAAPWQRLRRATINDGTSHSISHSAGASTTSPRVLVRADDFHVARIRQKSATTTIFVVDASGSSAMHRLAEAKGAVELLLADCYVRRDQVALIGFRGRQAELLLPPTRSLTAAKRRLSGLPGGGGTPLASALDAAAALVQALIRRGQSPMVVLMTDGRANVARDGSGGRERAQSDALQSARQLALTGAPLLLIDTSTKPQREAAELSQAMRARYLPLPHAGSTQLAQSVRVVTQQEARKLA
jgi:magnesium chelatase subunit D